MSIPVWISEDGSFKVEVIETVCVDPRFGELVIPQYRAECWAKDHGWTHVVTTANINILSRRLGPFLCGLIEFPAPDWEDDAMRGWLCVKGTGNKR